MDELRELIPEEARARGYILLYADTPKAVENAVKAYNLIMEERQAMVKRAKRCKDTVIIISAFVWALLMYFGLNGDVVGPPMERYLHIIGGFWSVPVCVSVMALYVPVFAYFGIVKDNTFVIAIAGAAFLAVNVWSSVPFAVNMLMWFIYRRNTDPIRRELEYPKFNTIDIKYQRFNKPDFDRKYT